MWARGKRGGGDISPILAVVVDRGKQKESRSGYTIHASLPKKALGRSYVMLTSHFRATRGGRERTFASVADLFARRENRRRRMM